ncbi:MATE family efflux transporter [Faecalimonas sp.]
MEETKQLGEQPIGKLLLKFSVPCVLGLLIGALYNIIDQIFIGNSQLGYLGNAATGISFPIICIANAFAWCIGDGAAAYLSICSGRRDSESAHKCVGTGITSTAIISVVLCVICLIFCKPLMVLFGASEATLKLACDYFYIVAAFFPLYLMFNVMNSMIRADGSPTYAMVALLCGAILNIILDPICIYLFDWGIQGAAIATVIGQVVSFFICAFYFKKPKSFRLTKESFCICPSILRNLITLGGSTFVIQIAMVVMTLLSNVMLFKYGNLSRFGSDIPISVFSIQTKVYTIVCNIVCGIALGGQPILGYNFGAKKMDRVKQCYKKIVVSSLTVGILATLIFICYPQIIIGIFGKQNELYMDFAIKSFRIFLGLSVITVFIKVSSIFFQAIGKPIEAMVASVLRDMLCFVTFTLVFCTVFESREAGAGIYGILVASPLSDIVAGIVIIILTMRFFKRLPSTSEVKKEPVTIVSTHPGTIITIARQHGTCGKRIGELVAKKLDIPFYCKELTAIAAKESGLAEEHLSSDYEQTDYAFQKLYLSTDVGRRGMIAQEQVLRKIADEGACVIVGRAANHVLWNYKDVVKVYLYAPEEYRIENIQEMYNDTKEQARQHMHRSDEARSTYYRNISGYEWKNMSNYNLCIDASLGKEAVAQLIVEYVEKRKDVSCL